jgi:hypothetical protein
MQVPEAWIAPLQLQTLSKEDNAFTRRNLRGPTTTRDPPGLGAVARDVRSHSSSSLSAQQRLAATDGRPPSVHAASTLSPPKVASVSHMPGLGQILPDGAGHRGGDGGEGRPRSLLGMQRQGSRAKGIADSMESQPAFEVPSM